MKMKWTRTKGKQELNTAQWDRLLVECTSPGRWVAVCWVESALVTHLNTFKTATAARRWAESILRALTEDRLS